ncbi:MAG: hypothetical protein WCL06_06185 [Bacteroidota bacterium]
MSKNLLSIFAILIALISLIISIVSLKIEKIGDANYLAVAATILTGAVTFAMGYNIYMNLSGTRKIAEEIAESKIADLVTSVNNAIQEKEGRMAKNVAANGNYERANFYFVIGNIQEESGKIDKVHESYKEALRTCEEAKKLFTMCEHPDMVNKCEDFIAEINKNILRINKFS